jgi:hypothetical protein
MPPLDAIATLLLPSKTNKKINQKKETQIHQLKR